jgi:hypothetical protein
VLALVCVSPLAASCRINIVTGKAKLIGSTGTAFGAEVFEGGNFYGGSLAAPNIVYELDRRTAATTQGATIARTPLKGARAVPSGVPDAQDINHFAWKDSINHHVGTDGA